jgi:hypothetical protein
VTSNDDVQIREVADRHRFEILLAGERVGHVTYRDGGGARTFIHTETDPDRQGQGLAGKLVKYALDAARADGMRVVAECSYVQAFIERNPDYADLVGGANS